MIKYLGSKRLLTERISAIVAAVPKSRSVIDVFSGTARVGHALKSHDFQVFSNDYTSYAYALAMCYVQSDSEDWETRATALLRELASTPPEPGYFTKVFCEEARFFKPENGARIDAIRASIRDRDLPPELEAIALVSLMEAADRVDSTTGVQMAYLKQWASRAHNTLALRLPRILRRAAGGKGGAFCLDARAAVKQLSADVAYVDPPYNQHSYLGNYHIWETLVRFDAPEAYGVARKRIDTRQRQSAFNSKGQHTAAMREVLEGIDARVVVVSFNNEGYLSRDDLVEMLAHRGEVLVLEHDFKRYVGAQIGIYNPQGAKVGAVSHLRNTELIYIAGHADDIAAVRKRVSVGDEQISLL